MLSISSLTAKIEQLIFSHRRWLISLFMIATLGMGLAATQLRIDAGFSKLLPLQHDYMQTFVQYQQEFGGADRIIVALAVTQGDIFTPDFFEALRRATDAVFFLPGVDRSQVRSLFTPNVRFTEVVEDGIAGGNVIPDQFTGTAPELDQVRDNILKAGIVGRLVANDFTSAIISAQLLEFNPNTGERLDYREVAGRLEQTIRDQYSSETIAVHIIGFASIIGAIADGSIRIVMFFVITLAITLLLLYFFTRSLTLALIPLTCSLIAVVWQLGLLTLLGYGLDPMSILVPFLVFAIAVSHGIQMLHAHNNTMLGGEGSLTAARMAFRRLLIPGSLALASDTIGFITILLIEIRIIQEMAIAASLGVAVIILTNLILLPVILSYITIDQQQGRRLSTRNRRMTSLWRVIAKTTNKGPALLLTATAIVIFLAASWKADDISIGDLHQGVPELRSESRYNQDSRFISEHFSIGVDVLTVIAETKTDACIDHDIMRLLDEFEWHLNNTSGVRSVVALPGLIRVINAGWNEGSLKWRELPRSPQVLAQSIAYIPTSSGLLNRDCSVIPLYIYTSDHKATTINSIIQSVARFNIQHDDVRLRLATGNVGVMAATNEVVEQAQFPILSYVFAAIIILCLITFRSWRATCCIVLPLALVSVLAYALMSLLQIGLKVSTLPVVALGIGIGVDYGIYIFSRLREHLQQGLSLNQAYQQTLESAGSAVIFTGLTLAIGVGSWIFSPLKFQADMGLLLAFMFFVNMLGAVLLLPALARLLLRTNRF